MLLLVELVLSNRFSGVVFSQVYIYDLLHEMSAVGEEATTPPALGSPRLLCVLRSAMLSGTLRLLQVGFLFGLRAPWRPGDPM